MAGHNKWSKVKHKKAKSDAVKSRVWTKIVREITVACRLGGADPSANPRLRKAIDDAKAAKMPKDTIERAVSKGKGDDSVSYEDLVYEGYGPGGVALLIECTTDNRNRTSGEVRSILAKRGGNLGATGSVSFLFDKKGHFVFDKQPEEGEKPTEDLLLEIGLSHGADDVVDDGDSFTVTCAPNDFQALREAYAARSLVPVEAKVAYLPQSTVKVTGDAAKNLLRIVDGLEELDDVQNVWANFDIDPAELEALMGE